MLRVKRCLAAYGTAWLEPDDAARRDLLTECWTEDGIYEDPLGKVIGREALVHHIGRFHRARPGARIEITTHALVCTGHVYFHWHMLDADGAVEIIGVDFGQLAQDGRLNRITGFFGTPAPIRG